MRIIVLGAGITGLSTAYFLEQRLNKAEVVLIEKQPRTGGWLRTTHKDGFLFESGPRSFRTSGHGNNVLELIRAVGLGNDLIGCSVAAKKRYVWHNDALHSAPTSIWQLLTSPLTRDLIPALIAEPFKKQGSKDESVYDFIERRFSKEVATRLIDPLTACIYGGDIHALSIKACFPQLKEWEEEHGSLLLAGLKQLFRKRTPSKTSFSLAALKKGMESLPQAITRQLKGKVLLSQEAMTIESHKQAIGVKLADGSVLEADAVVSTLPPQSLAQLTDYTEDGLPSASIAVVNVGWNQQTLKEQGFGCVFPSRSQSPLLGIVWDSSAFPQQNNHSQQTRLTLMLGGIHYPEVMELSEEKLISLSAKLLNQHLAIAKSPDATLCFRAHKAIPQYLIGHHERALQWKNQLAQKYPRLFVTGTPWDGVAVGACVTNAKQIAESVVEFAKN